MKKVLVVLTLSIAVTSAALFSTSSQAQPKQTALNYISYNHDAKPGF